MNSSDPVLRLRVLAAGLHAGLYAEEHLALPYDRVWTVVADLEAELPHLVPFLREFRVPPGDPDRKRALAVGRSGLTESFEVRLSPGWCLMQSRLIVGGMAAVPEAGGTRFAVLGATRPTALRPAQWIYGRLLGERRGRAFTRRVAERAVLR
ncbi:SRPBCC family protein [Streptomyces sp. NPDC049099]|uniref:SRPBCC family protein n=1 Tax=Streptomyces sp. NPDC049099 TaxID=3155768 RepID=UPI00341DEBBF